MSETDGTGRGADLFEQWLAHHEGRPEDVEPEPQQMPGSEASAHVEPQLPDHNVAAASVLAALRAEPDPEPAAVEDPAPVAAEPASADEVRAEQTRAPWPSNPPLDPVPSLAQTIFFKPRGGTQRILGLLLLGFLALTAGAAWWAYQDRSYTSYAIAGIVAVVTGVIWATRTSATPARLTLHGSELEIVRNGSKALFDLAHVQVEMHGTPGGRGWKVLILRRSMSPYVIDSSMVDPREFTYVVRYFHPEI
ncbi:hypothetical protein [Nocardioides nematodiphilus]|uniref:hypothetical protein n=1 Tax=Nocardioides nematodiphilus TaxID=2849669 RepID=UPI001CD961EE|nr:hypothetical protein [Nocardioides nematodiphilus]MCA1983414.1 hypothetical protein [Nocardioides nematodiphilus]